MINNQAQTNWIVLFEAFVAQPETMNSNISQETPRTSLGSKMNEKVKTAKESQSKSCSNI